MATLFLSSNSGSFGLFLTPPDAISRTRHGLEDEAGPCHLNGTGHEVSRFRLGVWLRPPHQNTPHRRRRFRKTPPPLWPAIEPPNSD